MSIDVGVVRIAVVFLPGIFARAVSLRMRASKNRGIWEDFLDILIFAFFSYALAALMLFSIDNHKNASILSKNPLSQVMTSSSTPDKTSILPDNFSAIIDNKPINWTELLVALGFSIVVGSAAAAVENHKVINKIGRLLRLTKTYGDDDVWAYLHNSSDFDWVFVRDYSKSITYYGHIKAFSDSYKVRELVLIDVRVYSNVDGKEIDMLPAVYLSFPDNNITIEIPQLIRAIPQSIPIADMESILSTKNVKVQKAFLKAYSLDEEKRNYLTKKKVSMRHALTIQAELNRLGKKYGKEE